MSIAQFKAEPKTVTETYKGKLITVKYDQEREVWHWWFNIQTQVIEIGDDATSINAAMRAAKKKIDTVEG